MNLDVGVGVDDCDHAWWAGEKLQFDAVSMKRLFRIKKKIPPTVPDEVDHKATEDSSTSRTTRKSNKKSGCYWRGYSVLLKCSFRECQHERWHHIMGLLLFISCRWFCGWHLFQLWNWNILVLISGR